MELDPKTQVRYDQKLSSEQFQESINLMGIDILIVK